MNYQNMITDNATHGLAAPTNTLIIVTMNRRKWSNKRSNDELAELVARESGIPREYISRIPVKIVPGNGPRDVNSLFDKAYTWARDHSTGWVRGSWVIPAHYYRKFSSEMHELRDKAMHAARTYVLQEYSHDVSMAKRDLLNKGVVTFPDDLWPTPNELLAMWGLDVRFEPLPDVSIVQSWGLDPETTADLANELAANLSDCARDAQRGVIDKLVQRATEFVNKVSHVHDAQARGENAKLFETAITNLAEWCEIVEAGLNIDDDDRLTRFAAELRDKVANVNAEQLRESPSLREKKMADVQDTISKMGAIYGQRN